jgi:hypothetical protein
MFNIASDLDDSIVVCWHGSETDGDAALKTKCRWIETTMRYHNRRIEWLRKKNDYLEDDFAVVRGTFFVSSGGGVRKEKLFCKLTDATVLVTADVLLLSSSMDDLLPRILQPNGDGSRGLLEDSIVSLFASQSMYF